MKELKLGMIVSAVFHVTLITVSVVGVPALMRSAPNIPIAIPVEIVDIDDVIRLRRAQDEPKPKPEPPARTAEAAPPKAVQAEPQPVKDAVPLPDAKPRKQVEPKEKPAVIPIVAPRSKPKPPSSLDTARLAALIDRSLEEKETARQQEEAAQEERDRKIDEAVRDAQNSRLASLRSTGTLKAVIKRRVESLWTIPVGAKDAGEIVVHIRLFLNPDGSLARPPALIDSGFMGSPDNNFYAVFAESALRAVRRAAPYDLPRDSYNQWRQIDLTFDAREMIGG